MKIPTKDEYFKKLRSNSQYLENLKQAPAEERKQIINTIEYIMGSIFDSMSHAFSNMNSNPDIQKEIVEALKTGNGIIKENDGEPFVNDLKKE